MKQKTLITLALLVFIIPFLGIPESWKATLLVLISLAIAYTTYNEEIKVFFTPKIHHDSIASEAFSKPEPARETTPSENI